MYTAIVLTHRPLSQMTVSRACVAQARISKTDILEVEPPKSLGLSSQEKEIERVIKLLDETFNTGSVEEIKLKQEAVKICIVEGNYGKPADSKFITDFYGYLANMFPYAAFFVYSTDSECLQNAFNCSERIRIAAYAKNSRSEAADAILGTQQPHPRIYAGVGFLKAYFRVQNRKMEFKQKAKESAAIAKRHNITSISPEGKTTESKVPFASTRKAHSFEERISKERATILGEKCRVFTIAYQGSVTGRMAMHPLAGNQALEQVLSKLTLK